MMRASEPPRKERRFESGGAVTDSWNAMSLSSAKLRDCANRTCDNGTIK
jgi:hypothetical protein